MFCSIESVSVIENVFTPEIYEYPITHRDNAPPCTVRVERHKLTDMVEIALTACGSGSLATVSGGETVQG